MKTGEIVLIGVGAVAVGGLVWMLCRHRRKIVPVPVAVPVPSSTPILTTPAGPGLDLSVTAGSNPNAPATMAGTLAVSI